MSTEHLTRTSSDQRILWSFQNDNVADMSTDRTFWWRRAGRPFATLLSKGDYSLALQQRMLLFFNTDIVPALGPGPDSSGQPLNWSSFMTDDFSPVEFGWEWGVGEGQPLVRFAFEPIGSIAGTALDPMNRHMALQFIRRTKEKIAECDLEWLEFFMDSISFNSSPNDPGNRDRYDGHKSSLFLGFDVHEAGLVLKAYLLPAARARELRISTWDMLSDMIVTLPTYRRGGLASFDRLQSFINDKEMNVTLQAEILAVDCLRPTNSRIKIYMRTRSTSFESVKRIMTLSGQSTAALAGSSKILKLKRLWYYCLCLDSDFSPEEELPFKAHRTAGILYYFELRPEASQPMVKLYIPVRHYAPNDHMIAKGLAQYWAEEGINERHADFMDVLRSIRPMDRLDMHCGVQTYVGCSFAGDEIKVTSYLSPLAYSAARSEA